MSQPERRTEAQVDAFIDWLGNKDMQDSMMVFMVLMYRNGYFDKADMQELLDQGGKRAE
jgi:hypothetical protein